MSDGQPSRPRSHGWRRAALACAVLALLVVRHYVWFTVLGPPARWGTGVVSVDPTIERADASAIEPGERNRIELRAGDELRLEHEPHGGLA